MTPARSWRGYRPGVGPDRSTRFPRVLEALTPREAEILRLVARRLPNAEIAARAFASEPTVKATWLGSS